MFALARPAFVESYPMGTARGLDTTRRAFATWAATVLVFSASASAVRGQAEFGVLLSPDLGRQPFKVDYRAGGYFDVDVDDQDTEMQMTQHRLGLSLPVMQDERREWLISTRFGVMDLHTSTVLPDTREPLPNQLWDLRVGTSYRRKLDSGWIAGGTFSVGSASNRLFASGAETIVHANGFVRIPSGQRNAWLFLLNYANDREFLPHVPIPGVGYQVAPNRKFRALLGAPVSSLHVEPIDGLTLDASYFLVRTVHAEIGYRILAPLKLYAGFHWDNQRFYLTGREDDDDRLFYYEKRVVGGIRWDIVENVWLDCSAGWAFDRFFFEAESYRDRDENRIDISDGPMLQLRLGVSF